MRKSKKENLASFHRQSIIDTATQLFIQKGITETTMDDIAKAADYSKSTIYVYFKSKDEIFNHIVYNNILMLKSSLEEAIKSSENVEDCFYSFCNAHVDFQEQYPLYFDTMMNSIKKGEEEIRELPILQDIVNVSEEIDGLIIAFLEKGIEQKQIRSNIESLQTAFTLWASICGIISMSYKKEEYIKRYMKVSKSEYLQNGFKTLLNSILINPK